jgi:hypothetical protein
MAEISSMKSVLRLVAQFGLMLFVSAFVLVERGRTMCDPFFLLPLASFSGLLVGPMLIDSFRKNRSQPTAALLTGSVTRAVGVVMLILMLSLALVNLFSWNGQVLLPNVETAIWAVALSITAAVAAAAGLVLALSRLPLNTVRWGFRAAGVLVFLAYWELPMGWPVSWYALVADWGLSPVAFGWVLLLASIAAAALFFLKRGPETTQMH